MMPFPRAALVAAVIIAGATSLAAQTPPAPRPDAPRPAAPPRPAPPAPGQAGAAPGQAPAADVQRQPPAGSPPVVRLIEIRAPKQGNALSIEAQTYLYYIQTKPSRPSEGAWLPYDEQTVLDDFKRLWNTNFLDDLSIEVLDLPYPNGVIGKHVIFNLEERQRVKIVEYVNTSKVIEQTKIDEQLKEKGAQIRLDTFIDPGLIRRVEGVIREMLSEKGYLGATITHETKEVGGGPKLVNLQFLIDEGPQYKIRDIDFVGNTSMSDGSLKRRMKENKEQWFLSFATGRGTYQETKFEEDADKVIEHYRDNGYIAARVGQPEIKILEDSPDRKTRYVQVRVPVEEGRRYRVGTFEFDGNTVVKGEALRPLFKVKEGEFYSEKAIRKGLEKAREVYGGGGYFEFTGFPDLKPRDAADGAPPAPIAAVETGPPVIDVTMRMQEGKQYFVNRITFVGNTTTRDNVIRREVRLYEGGVFNTEALKYSVRRLNQLGYFKNLEGDAIKVDKSPGVDNKVDVTLKFEEQNRNQLTFGAGVSQFEGFFGQLSFQTSNFMGRGETLTLALQAGSRSQNYQVAFTEPFLFDRAITGGFDVYKREIRYPYQFTQDSIGTNVIFGFPLADFTRVFAGYSFESVRVKDINEAFLTPEFIINNPYLAEALLLGQNGERTISKITPSLVHNTIDSPVFPTRGRRFTTSVEIAGLGGNTAFWKPRVEGVYYIPQTRRLSIGLRGQLEYVQPYQNTIDLPIFERLALGGEYSVRGFDIRSIGPRTPTGLVVGGNKSLLFNAEYLISIAGPVRLVLFYDAGQVPGFEPVLTPLDGSPVPSLPPVPALPSYRGFSWSEFKTSTGAEVRFFMPVLNVPFRLIFAYNPQREGVLQNDLRPQDAFTFRFAVGSTF
jgi:outer membrane protein insertion porin family